jgi:hypothetical protein
VLQRGNDLMIDFVAYDWRTELTHTERIIVRDGCVRRAAFSVRLYSFTEFARLLGTAGFRSTEGSAVTASR